MKDTVTTIRAILCLLVIAFLLVSSAIVQGSEQCTTGTALRDAISRLARRHYNVLFDRSIVGGYVQNTTGVEPGSAILKLARANNLVACHLVSGGCYGLLLVKKPETSDAIFVDGKVNRDAYAVLPDKHH